ncbi:MAG TPA: hypothetical protein VIJ31_12460, partial [Acidothermaceae bacterium]
VGAFPEPPSRHESSTGRLAGRTPDGDTVCDGVVNSDGDALDDEAVHPAAKSSMAPHAVAPTDL